MGGVGGRRIGKVGGWGVGREVGGWVAGETAGSFLGKPGRATSSYSPKIEQERFR